MNSEKIRNSLLNFQSFCEKKSNSMGYSADISQSIFSYIIEMRNIMVAVDNQNTFQMHHAMGCATEAICKFASANNIIVADCLEKRTYTEIFHETSLFDFEHSLSKIKEDLDVSIDIQMSEEEKIIFIQKAFISIYPESYYNDFLKIDRVLALHIEKLKENKN